MKPIVELLHKRDSTVYKVAPDVTVFDGLKLLSDYGVGAMLVMDGETLVGVLSERDYTRKVALQGKNSRETRVAEIMTRDVITVGPQTRTRECMALMSQHKIRHLPVVDNGKVIGMISIRDIMDDIIADHEQTIAQLQTYISS
ncbi:MAG: CBS domain-containing protein [Burkholderiaceae bacterium]|nr:CBS domain-containing protein [Rhodoferax sp.]MCB2031034.1 CBS domain-containing protein [Rhodoferax sp.]MCP5260547.1 CBS domain-containing protein [Rhodoferax sp.]MCW5628064.1 CBS domain-containing protein [Rhodoferax sp.]MCW5645317.1 CBS domain-containing protein [Rhodoferax sp.]